MIKIKKLIADNFKQLTNIEITFPQKGSFLIEGLNEAGKSTLFEAIYFGLFGEALVTETGSRRSVSDLINYHSKYAYVELQIEVRDKILNIYRTINLNSPNQWKLEIQDETITKNAAVNERLLLELGLDGDALLNSCFVEQKKLEKLEGLTKQEREKSLMKLLNLDRMLELERSFKVKREEEDALQKKQQKLELAKLKYIDLPNLQNEKTNLELKLEIINLLKLNQKINEEKGKIKALLKAIKIIEPEKQTLEKRIERIDTLKKNQNSIEKIISNLNQIKEQTSEINTLKKQIEDLDRLNENIPTKEKLINNILSLGKRLSRINKLEELFKLEKENINSIDKELEQIKKLKSSIAKEELKQKQKSDILTSLKEKETILSKQLKLVNEKEALENWRRAKHTIDAIEIINKKEKELLEKKAINEEEKRQHQKKYKKRLLSFSLLNIIVIISLIISLIKGLGIIGIIIGIITLIGLCVGIIYIKKHKDMILSISSQIKELDNEMLRLDGQRQSARDKGEQDETKLTDYEDKLLKLNLRIPENIDLADMLINELADKLKGVNAEEIKIAYPKITNEIAALESAISSLNSIIENYKEELAHLNESKLLKDKEKAINKKDKLNKIINKFKPKLQQKARNLNQVLDREKLLAEYNQLRTEVKRDLQDVAKKDQLSEKIKERNEIIGKLDEEINLICASNPQIPKNLTLRDYDRITDKIKLELKDLNEEDTLQKLKTLQSKIDAYKGEISVRERNLNELEKEKDRFSKKAKSSLRYSHLSIQQEPTIIKEKEEIEAKIGYLKTHIYKLTNELQIKDIALNVEECEKEVNDLAVSLKIRKLAEQILINARNNIVAKVLPNTIRNMQRILPLLTCDRYHDADITEDYKIKVWDERAMKWCAKNIFSGGTKDQFSLALRIAFAIATLPEEKGIAPSFIFLDEPLSSFDTQRSQALIYLLTQGEIMEVFDQIFIISHSQLLDPSLFNYYIKMDSGRIVEHNL